ncbi:helix-turn-helix domain-containing protein [Streptomyces sp. NPDC055036]
MWTRAGVGDLIAKLHRMGLAGQGVDKYLRRWGLPFQRPDERAIEQDAEAVGVRPVEMMSPWSDRPCWDFELCDDSGEARSCPADDGAVCRCSYSPGAELTARRVLSAWVAEPLDVGEPGLFGVVAGEEDSAVEGFRFRRGEEALRDGVVVAGADPAG